MELYLNFEENEYSKIFDNQEFGYWKITVERPLRRKAEVNREKIDEFKQIAEEAKDNIALELVQEVYQENKKEFYDTYMEFEEKVAKAAKKKALQRVMDIISENAQKTTDIPVNMFGISHCNNYNDAEFLKEQIMEQFQPCDVLINDMGSTIATYAGEGGMVISF
jgi:hypothetical protein